MEARTDARDGWVHWEDSVICPACRKEWVEAEPVALGGNCIPSVLVCASCGDEARNPPSNVCDYSKVGRLCES